MNEEIWVCVNHNVNDHDLIVRVFNGKNVAFDYAAKKATLLIKKLKGGSVHRTKKGVNYKNEEGVVTIMWDISENSMISAVKV